MAQALDPITLEVLTQALVSTVREMRATVSRTASSVAIYDAKDYSCGLFAPDSQVVAQSEDIGSHVVPLPWTVRSAFFPAVRAHWADVGGMVPGSMSGKATEIYQEGIRIPPIKIMEGGKMNAAALDLLLANMRVPEERLGDLRASITACRVAEMRIHEICERHGVDKLLE